jgi:hypothetical protein
LSRHLYEEGTTGYQFSEGSKVAQQADKEHSTTLEIFAEAEASSA